MLTTMTNLNWSTASHKTILHTNTTLLVFYSKKLEEGTTVYGYILNQKHNILLFPLKKHLAIRLLEALVRKYMLKRNPEANHNFIRS